MKKRFIKASEFGQWEYCPRQWYLSKTMGKRISSEASRRGVAYHNSKSEGVKSIQHDQTKFIYALVIGGILCIYFFLLH
jgi:CRISPR/Cas system-associated exonuclease Cas4 (RecB family)